jgi:type IV secretory pathway protease TraF
MLPGLKPGQIIIAKTKIGKLKQRSIVIVEHDNLEKIKRIKAIKNNRIYLLGDNPQESVDSRQFGWLTSEQVIGEIIWPRK